MRTFLLTSLSRLLKMKGLKHIYVLFEFKHTEFFTCHGGYLLNSVHTISFWCRIFRSRSRWRKILITGERFVGIGQGKNHFLGDWKTSVSEKLYRNTLMRGPSFWSNSLDGTGHFKVLWDFLHWGITGEFLKTKGEGNSC